MDDNAKRILLIEDDKAIRYGLSYALSRRGYQVSECVLLHDAEVALVTEQLDLVITDVGLPDGSGLDFLVSHPNIPFIVMSASECAKAAVSCGAKAFIEKPFRIDDMMEAVSSALYSLPR